MLLIFRVRENTRGAPTLSNNNYNTISTFVLCSMISVMSYTCICVKKNQSFLLFLHIHYNNNNDMTAV